jgi:MTH538 TIR-like domain (DUF1863)
MAYRNGTYVAFHANGTNRPGESDISYYNLMKAWTAKTDDDFSMTNSHEKTNAVRDSSLHETLRRAIVTRLCNSKNMVLVIGETTRFDTDWVPFEIEKAVDSYQIPIIVTYTAAVFDGPIRNPEALSAYWPQALAARIKNGTAHTIHIPFKKAAISDAIGQFSHNNYPTHTIYSNAAYIAFGIPG